jgi:biopolymer transport protein TolQ
MIAFVATAAAMAPAKETVSISIFDTLGSASPIVQLVLLILVGISVLSWGIIISKWGAVKRCFRSTEKFLDVFWSGKSMDHIYSESKKYTNSAVAKIFQSGYVELQRLLDKERQKPTEKITDPLRAVPADSSLQNLERALTRANRSETLRLERSLTFLATAGSTAPFIGLFGTVWGIMTAFVNIGVEKTASLATVAPGIAEALVATAMGLACAIPAVMAYNYYSQRVRVLRAQMDNFSGDFLNIVKRNFLTG